jgi:alanyl-tRNA synthetase
MGMERICMILQKEESVYDTDCFRYLFGYAQALTGAHFYKDDDISVHVMAAYKIFADHMRTTVNALFDGVEFDGHGKGQVLRKIFRRALTHTYIYLNNGVFEPLMIKDAVRGMITDILCYFLKAKHDADDIQSKLIAEEKLALGTWFQTKKRYNKLIKKKTSQEDIEKTLKMSGVTKVIIDNLHRLEFHMNHDK